MHLGSYLDPGTHWLAIVMPVAVYMPKVRDYDLKLRPGCIRNGCNIFYVIHHVYKLLYS